MSAIRHPLANGLGRSARPSDRTLPAERPEFQYAQIPEFPGNLQIVDLVIPNLDGLSVLSQLQSQEADIVFVDVMPRHAATAPRRAPPGSPELRWLRANRQALPEYRGEWLLISGDKLLCHSRSFGDVKAAIRCNNVASPFVYYVPTEDESNFVIL